MWVPIFHTCWFWVSCFLRCCWFHPSIFCCFCKLNPRTFVWVFFSCTPPSLSPGVIGWGSTLALKTCLHMLAQALARAARFLKLEFLANPTTCGIVLFLFSFIELSGWSIGLRWRLKRKQLRGNTSSTTPLLALNCPNNEVGPSKLTVFPGDCRSVVLWSVSWSKSLPLQIKSGVSISSAQPFDLHCKHLNVQMLLVSLFNCKEWKPTQYQDINKRIVSGLKEY